jgi:drug/metabolite transporter (DMT)-like permease
MMRPADVARLLLLSVMWGASFLFIKVGLEDFHPWQIVAGRLVLGALVLVTMLRARGLHLPRERSTWAALVFMAIVANLVPFSLITWGEESISSSLAAILNSTTPLFTATIASLALPGERLTRLRTAGILLGFIGVGVIVGIDVDSGNDLLGELAVVLASASYAVGFVFARRRLVERGESSLTLSAGQLLVASGIAIFPAAWATGTSPAAPGSGALAAVFMLGVFGTGFAYVLYYRLVTDVGATSASFVTYLLPIFGVVLGSVFLDERIGWNTVAGAALVFMGIWIAERGARKPPHHDLEPAEISASEELRR